MPNNFLTFRKNDSTVYFLTALIHRFCCSIEIEKVALSVSSKLLQLKKSLYHINFIFINTNK